MQKFINWIKNRHLRTKLLLSYSLVVFVPVTIIFTFFVSNVIKESANQDALTSLNSFSQTVSSVDDFFNDYIMLSNSLKYDTLLTEYLVKQYTPSTDYVDKYQEYYEIYSTYTKRLSYWRIDGTDFHIYTDNNEIVCYNNLIYKSVSETVRSLWYRQALINTDSINVCLPEKINGEYRIPLTTNLTSKNKNTNILRIDIPADNLCKLLQDNSKGKTIFIVNESGDIIASTNDTDMAKNLGNTAYKAFASHISKDKNETNFSDGSNTVYIGRISGDTKLGACWVVEISPSEPTMARLRRVAGLSLVVCLYVGIIDIVLIILLSNQMSSKISRLVNSIRAVKAGNLHIKVDCEGRDEISELSRSFSEMMDSVNTLIDQVYVSELHGKESELKAREAEIHALQSQIDPHFLFNSLNSINTSALMNQDFATSDIIVSFSSLIRKSIDWKSDFIPLSGEIKLVQDYLKILNARYMNNLQCTITIDHRFEPVDVPKFILQPIIENAVIHGIGTKNKGGRIDISCEQCAEDLKISVTDNGVGMPEEELEKLRQRLNRWNEKENYEHIGLINIQQRIKLLYGGQYGLEISSEIGRGTVVSVILPVSSPDVSSDS